MNKESRDYFLLKKIKEKDQNAFNEFYLKNEMDETINLTDSIEFEFIKKRGEMVILDDSKEVNLLKDKCFNRLKELSLDNDTYIEKRVAREILSTIENIYFGDEFKEYRVNQGSNGARDLIIKIIQERYDIK